MLSLLKNKAKEAELSQQGLLTNMFFLGFLNFRAYNPSILDIYKNILKRKNE